MKQNKHAHTHIYMLVNLCTHACLRCTIPTTLVWDHIISFVSSIFKNAKNYFYAYMSNPNTKLYIYIYSIYTKLTLCKGLVAVAKLLAFHARFAEMDVQSFITLTIFKLPILVDYLLSCSHNTSFILFSYYFRMKQKKRV